MLNLSTLPLNGLRAFESAARHLSFTQAASELSVTQGAISRHVKGLEDFLKTQLFERRHKKLSLTDKGQFLLQGISGAFEQIQDTVQALDAETPELNVKVLPTIAVRWLIPRLHRFEISQPDIPLNLTTAWMCFDPAKDSHHAGIAYQSDIWPEKPLSNSLRYDLIFDEWMTPVCAPGYLERKAPITHPEDLLDHVILCCKGNHGHDDWKVWAEQLELENFTPKQQLNFDFLDIALNAAAAGQGIALGDIRLVQGDIAAGRLICPLQIPPQKIGTYYLMTQRRARPHPGLAPFRDWLMAEAEQEDLPLT